MNIYRNMYVFYKCKCFRYLTILQKVYLFDVTNQQTKKSTILKKTGVLLISMLFEDLLLFSVHKYRQQQDHAPIRIVLLNLLFLVHSSHQHCCFLLLYPGSSKPPLGLTLLLTYIRCSGH